MGGQNRKRLRGLKTTRLTKRPSALRIRSKILNDQIRKVYDKSKSPKENLKSFGLDADINHFNTRSSPQAENVENNKEGGKKLAAFVGLAVVSQGDGVRFVNKKRSDIVMSDFERQYAKKNIDKHGDNYKAMERDIKLNFFQHSEYKMQQLCER